MIVIQQLFVMNLYTCLDYEITTAVSVTQAEA